MEKHRICRQGQTGQEVRVVGKRFGRWPKQTAAGHQTAVAKVRVGAARFPTMSVCFVRFSEDRRSLGWPILRVLTGQNACEEDDLRRKWRPHFS